MEIILNSVVSGLPDDHEVEFAGKIDEETFFVIYRPESSPDVLDWKVSIGPADALEDVELWYAYKHDSGAILLFTVKGPFIFPPPHRKDIPARFNYFQIEVF